MIDKFITNPTQLTGVLAFAVATTACAIASRRTQGRDMRLWTLLAAVNFLFFVEIFAGFRHRIHDFADGLLMARGLYDERHGPQEMIVMSVGAIAVVFVLLPLLLRRISIDRAPGHKHYNCVVRALCNRDRVAPCNRRRTLSPDRTGLSDRMDVGGCGNCNMPGGDSGGQSPPPKFVVIVAHHQHAIRTKRHKRDDNAGKSLDGNFLLMKSSAGRTKICAV